MSSSRRKDSLWRGDVPNWRDNACFGGRASSFAGAYAEGYLRGARFLVEKVLEERSGQDFLIYPIVFLYRHHIEIMLKGLIQRCPFLDLHPLTSDEKKHLRGHNLDFLWKNLQPRLATIIRLAGWKPLLQEEEVTGYLCDLSAMDPHGEAFRYAHNNKGGPSIPSGVGLADMRHFSERIERLINWLETLEIGTESLMNDLASSMNDC